MPEAKILALRSQEILYHFSCVGKQPNILSVETCVGINSLLIVTADPLPTLKFTCFANVSVFALGNFTSKQQLEQKVCKCL